MKTQLSLSVLLILLLTYCNAAATTITVTNGNDSGAGSLRDAVSSAVSGDMIVFSGVSVVNLTSGEIEIRDKDITIDGGSNGVEVTRNTTTLFRIFWMRDIFSTTTEQVVLKNLSITNGRNEAQGGGIQNELNLTMENCTVSGNRSDQGAGIQNDEVLHLNNCLIIDNIRDGGLIAGGSMVTATNTVFSGNGGFGLTCTTGQLTLSNCIFSNNYQSSGTRPGRGINISDPTNATIINCTFANNQSDGLNLANFADGVTLTNNIFANNGTDIDVSNSGPNLSASSTHNFIAGTESAGLVDGVNGNIVNKPANFFNINDPDGADDTWLTADDGLAITAASLALDNGTNTSVPTLDIVGKARPYDSGIADIGAYEFSQPIPLPEFTGQPQDTLACDAGGASFSVTSNNATTFQWQEKVGAAPFQNLTDNVTYSGTQTAELLILNTTGLGGNQYRCVISNVLNQNETSSIATLTLTVPPNISYTGQNTGYQTGVPITSIQALLGGGTPTSITSSPNLVAGLTIDQITGDISGTPTTTSSSRIYTITATNACGSGETTVEFSIGSSARPVITMQPVDAFVCPAAPASFTIAETGSSVDIQWQVNSGSAWVNINENAPYSDTDDETLEISGTAGLNGFLYRCVVSNNSGTVISEEVKLNEGMGKTTVTNDDDSGQGSLRDAIDCSSAGDTIIFAPNITNVELRSGGELIINKSLVIDGRQNNVTIERRGLSKFRIFDVRSGIDVIFKNLTITNGETTDQSGGIQNSGTLKLYNCIITDNSSPQSNGIQNDHIIHLYNCVVSDNNGSPNANGMGSFGDSTIAVNTLFSNNGGDGLSTLTNAAVISLTNCVFVGNNRNGLTFSGAVGSEITNSTFVNNGSSGIELNDKSPNITIKNSIFSGNSGDISLSSPSLGSTNTNNLIGSNNAGGLVDGVNGNKVNVQPLFLNSADPDGADNIWLTADDGYSLNACSPAVDMGIASGAPSVDITNNTRSFNGGQVDIGAYEFQGASALAITPSNVNVDLIDVCPGSTVNLSASCPSGSTVTWYYQAANGTFVGSGSPLAQNPTVNTTYYAACNSGACEGTRVATEEVQMLPSGGALNNTVTISADITSDNTQLANEYINSSFKIIAPANVIFHSGKAVNLLPGFEVETGAVFLGRADLTTCP